MRYRTRLVKALLASLVITVPTVRVAYAAGFSLYTEGSPAAIGNFAAGISAEAGDAAIGWYNPAGLPLIGKEQLLVGVVGVLPSIELTGVSTFSTEDVDSYIQGFNDLQGGRNAAIPVIHYVLPFGDRAAFGFSILSPFGLSTQWGEDSAVRYAGTLSELITVDISPEIGGKLTDHISAGVGLDLQWLKATLDSVLGSPAALQYLQSIGGLVTPTTLDSLSHNYGTSFGIGFHAGILGAFNDDHTRIGFNYQSSIQQRVRGSSVLTGRLADPELTDPDAVYRTDAMYSDPVRLPAIATLSLYHDVNKQLALLASMVYTGWNRLERITLNNVAAYSSDLSTQVYTSTSLRENYRSTWRFAAGANVHVTSTFMLRVGGGYDQTPTIDAERDVRLPDADRWAISIGAHYQMYPSLAFDLGYTYLWAPSSSGINKTIPIGTYSAFNVNAQAQTHGSLVGLQAVWNFDQGSKSVSKTA